MVEVAPFVRPQTHEFVLKRSIVGFVAAGMPAGRDDLIMECNAPHALLDGEAMKAAGETGVEAQTIVDEGLELLTNYRGITDRAIRDSIRTLVAAALAIDAAPRAEPDETRIPPR